MIANTKKMIAIAEGAMLAYGNMSKNRYSKINDSFFQGTQFGGNGRHISTVSKQELIEFMKV